MVCWVFAVPTGSTARTDPWGSTGTAGRFYGFEALAREHGVVRRATVGSYRWRLGCLPQPLRSAFCMCGWNVAARPVCSPSSPGTYMVLAPHLRGGPPVPKPNLRKCIIVLLAYPLMLLGTCLGPLLHYAYKLRGVLTGRAIPRSKTARIAESAASKQSSRSVRPD